MSKLNVQSLSQFGDAVEIEVIPVCMQCNREKLKTKGVCRFVLWVTTG